MIEIVIPQIGEAAAEVILIQWLKAEGDPVRKGELLFAVDTAKAVVDVEAFADGTLVRIVVPAGSTVVPQQVVAWLEPAGEATEAGPPLTSMAAPQMESAAVPATRRSVSPKARRLAEEKGVDLDQVSGSGLGGMVTAKDVEAAAPAVASPERVGPQPLSRHRQAIAQRMLSSKQTAPHFYLMAEVDMGEVQQLRAHCREALAWERPPSYTEAIVHACALALADMPSLNVTYTNEGLLPRPSVDIGLAVSLDEGPVVAVLHRADGMSLLETSQGVQALVTRAHQGRLRDMDLSSRSMVVTNLGMYGVDAFIAIIDPPDPMILAVGRVADRVVPVAGQTAIAVRPMATLALSIDHRVMDGVPGAQFLTRVKGYLEDAMSWVREEP